MSTLNTTDLAKELKLTKGRISQYVAQGKLEGCYSGDGRARRFKLDAVLHALGRKLDQGQMLGNGASTRKAIAALQSREDQDDEELPRATATPGRSSGAGATELEPNDSDRYELARTLKVEQEARRLLRNNAIEEGSLVLASEAARQTARLVAQEVSEFENALRDGARLVADKMGVDYKTVRQHLLTTWREHRAKRSLQLQDQAETAGLTDAEREADI